MKIIEQNIRFILALILFIGITTVNIKQDMNRVKTQQIIDRKITTICVLLLEQSDIKTKTIHSCI